MYVYMYLQIYVKTLIWAKVSLFRGLGRITYIQGHFLTVSRGRIALNIINLCFSSSRLSLYHRLHEIWIT